MRPCQGRCRGFEPASRSIFPYEIMKIEFGAGGKAKEGYVSSDIRNLLGVTYVCACWDIHHHVETNSVEAIYSRHMFEHLTFAQGEKTLGVWYKILKKVGKLGWRFQIYIITQKNT